MNFSSSAQTDVSSPGTFRDISPERSRYFQENLSGQQKSVLETVFSRVVPSDDHFSKIEASIRTFPESFFSHARRIEGYFRLMHADETTLGLLSESINSNLKSELYRKSELFRSNTKALAHAIESEKRFRSGPKEFSSSSELISRVAASIEPAIKAMPAVAVRQEPIPTVPPKKNEVPSAKAPSTPPVPVVSAPKIAETKLAPYEQAMCIAGLPEVKEFFEKKLVGRAFPICFKRLMSTLQ